MIVKTNKREKPHNKKENGKIGRGDEKKKDLEDEMHIEVC